MNNTKTIRFQMRRDDVIDNNDILLSGEPGIKNGAFKIGDGKKAWKDLPLVCVALDEALNYKPIDITTFSANPSVAEIGSTKTVVLSWNINKTPTLQTLDGVVIANSKRSETFTEIEKDTTYTLEVKDEKGKTDTSYAYVKFYNGVYYGVAEEPASYNSNFIKGLSKPSLQSSRAKTFPVTAGDREYIYYCLPTRLGTPNFNIGGFDGGFEKASTIQFTNASGYPESYDIYKSENANLGDTTVKVS
jgi:hypothetical protein